MVNQGGFSKFRKKKNNNNKHKKHREFGNLEKKLRKSVTRKNVYRN